MIDLHNHLLPGIDDGAEDVEASLAMARQALASGTTHLVCTPHIHPGRYDNTPEKISAALGIFRSALADAGLALQVAAAAEVRFDIEIMAALPEGRLPFLGKWEGRDVLLLEFPHSDIPFGAERLIKWLLARGVLPLIAHPERNKGVMSSPARLKPLLAQGCLVQVTAGALAGRFGARAQELAESLLREGVVTILASDAHNTRHRPPLLSEGFDAAARIVGEAAAMELVLHRPWAIAAHHFG